MGMNHFGDPFVCEVRAVALRKSFGTLSPQLTYEWWQVSRFWQWSIQDDMNLVLVPANDLICTIVNGEIVKILLEFYEFFESHELTFEPMYGYGLMELVANISANMGLANLRLRSNIMVHPTSRSYSKEAAIQERDKILRIVDDFLRSRFNQSFIELNSIRLSDFRSDE